MWRKSIFLITSILKVRPGLAHFLMFNKTLACWLKTLSSFFLSFFLSSLSTRARTLGELRSERCGTTANFALLLPWHEASIQCCVHFGRVGPLRKTLVRAVKDLRWMGIAVLSFEGRCKPASMLVPGEAACLSTAMPWQEISSS